MRGTRAGRSKVSREGAAGWGGARTTNDRAAGWAMFAILTRSRGRGPSAPGAGTFSSRRRAAEGRYTTHRPPTVVGGSRNYKSDACEGSPSVTCGPEKHIVKPLSGSNGRRAVGCGDYAGNNIVACDGVDFFAAFPPPPWKSGGRRKTRIRRRPPQAAPSK